jgi:hypothetical protein
MIFTSICGEYGGWEVLEGFGQGRMRPVMRSSTMTKQQFSDYPDSAWRKNAQTWESMILFYHETLDIAIQRGNKPADEQFVAHVQQ